MPKLFRLLALALALSLPASAAEAPFVSAAQVDLLHLLPPPPADDSPQTRAEMAEVLALQASRTPQRAAQASVDSDGEDVFTMFTPVLGPNFSATRLPLASKFFDRIGETEEEVTASAKSGFSRKRPFQLNADVHPAVRLSRSGSWPSGHTTRVTMMAAALAAMVPEQRDAIWARSADYAESRVIGGVHYRSDLVAGTRAGTAAAAVMWNDPAFHAEWEAARREVRAGMGLPG